MTILTISKSYIREDTQLLEELNAMGAVSDI